MARGINEQDVHRAADEVVFAGERPTVERVRAHLGTGSPNTVIRHLDSWWLALATRLKEEEGTAALPDAPPALARLAGEWWAVALRAAADQANADLAAAHATLDDERSAAQERERIRRAECEQLADAAAAALQAQTVAEHRLSDAQQLIDQLRTQLIDLTGQRDHAIKRAARLDAELGAHMTRLAAREDEDIRMRVKSAEHLRAVEDRAHAEVDRARQDTRALQKELEAVRQAHQSALIAQRDREAVLQERITEAVRDTAVAQAQVAALKQRARGPDRAGKPAAPRKKREVLPQASASAKKPVRRRRLASKG